MTNKNITITGELGSGKSSVASTLKNILGYKLVSVGIIQRELAAKYNMSANEFNKYMELHPEIDAECDRRVAELGRQGGLIFDSRLAWRFVPQSFKVFLTVDEDIAARRILGDKDRIGEAFSNPDEAKRNIKQRRDSERLRFRNQYGVELADFDNYDIVIDTGKSTPQATATCIVGHYRLHGLGQPFRKLWLGDWPQSSEFLSINNL
jgi:cytidylate kinase